MTSADVSPRARAHPQLVPLWRGLVVYRVVTLVAALVNVVRFAGDGTERRLMADYAPIKKK